MYPNGMRFIRTAVHLCKNLSVLCSDSCETWRMVLEIQEKQREKEALRITKNGELKFH